MFVRLITDPHWFVSSIPIKVIEDGLDKMFLTCDTIERLIPEVFGRGDVFNVVEVSLHFLEVTDVVQCSKHIIGIAQPAITIVPVSSASVVLRETGSTRGDNSSCILELMNLYYQCRTNNIWPIKRCDRCLLCPLAPVKNSCRKK